MNVFERDGITLSDTILLNFGADALGSFFDITFTSDSENGPPLTPLPAAFSTIENGILQGGPVVSWNFGGANQVTDLILFQSDIDSPIPEPSTFALVALGLMFATRARKLAVW